MTTNPSQKDMEELHEARHLLQSLQTEWLEVLEELTQTKEGTRNGDLFATIDYLTFCDYFCKNISVELKAFDSQLKQLTELRNRLFQQKINLDAIDQIIKEMQELRNSQQSKMQNIDDEYSILAESILRQSEDLIAHFTQAMQNEKTVPTLKNQLNQNLEKELFLQELRDSLETYREAREDFISELTTGTSLQKLPEGTLSEDLGEDKPEIDSILSQLDTLITSCDTALLMKEIQD
jgi:small-conductance mechanosensitive channel